MGYQPMTRHQCARTEHVSNAHLLQRVDGGDLDAVHTVTCLPCWPRNQGVDQTCWPTTYCTPRTQLDSRLVGCRQQQDAQNDVNGEF